MNRFLPVWAAGLVLVVLGLQPALAGPVFNFTADDLLGPNWDMIVSGTMANGTPFSNDAGTLSPPVYSGEFLNSSAYGAPLPPGFIGLAGCGVGDNDSLQYVSLALSGVDLGRYDSYVVTLSNDDDDPWQYRLLADDGSATALGPWTPINPDGGRQTLSLDISDLEGTGVIGFQIGSDVREDCFHTSVFPIPAPGALLLGGIGSLVVRRLRTRRYL